MADPEGRETGSSRKKSPARPKLGLDIPPIESDASTSDSLATWVALNGILSIDSPHAQIHVSPSDHIVVLSLGDAEDGAAGVHPRDGSFPVVCWNTAAAAPEIAEHPLARGFPPLPDAPATVRVETVSNSKHGRTLALVAARDIQVGEAFLAERPLLLLQSSVPFEDVRNLESLTGPHLTDPQKTAIWSLHNARPTSEPDDEWLCKVLSNNFSAEFPMEDHNDKGLYWVTFDLMSHANHSCEANAWFEFSYDDLCGYFTARAPIPEGKEVTIEFVDGSAPYEERRDELWARFNFRCTCRKCEEDTE